MVFFYGENDRIGRDVMTNRKHYYYLFLGLGISNIGAWIYLIALNLLLLKETGSAMTIAYLYILNPIAALLVNGFSGTFIDRMNPRKLMITLDLCRAILIALIPFCESISMIYLFAFLVCIANAIFSTTSIVYLTKLVPTENRQKFNAIKNLIDSCGTLFGPALTGLLFIITTAQNAIFFNAIALVFSAILISLLPNVSINNHPHEKFSMQMIKMDFKAVWRFSKKRIIVSKVYLLFCGMTIFMTAIDSIEAAFAKEELRLSNTSYSSLLVTFGIGIIISSWINTRFHAILSLRLLIAVGSLFTSVGYILYYFSQNYISALIGISLVGFSISFANTGFFTYQQNNVPSQLMGRFISIFSLIESSLIIILTLAIGSFTEIRSIRLTGQISSICFIVLAIYTASVVRKIR